MNAIANGLKENKTFMSKFFAELDAITATMPRTFNLGTKIPVNQRSFEEPITVQIIQDDIVTFCNHDGAVVGIVFSGYYDSRTEDIVDLPQDAFLCDKCEAWQDLEGNWNE